MFGAVPSAMASLSSSSHGLMNVIHPERDGDDLVVTLPGLYQIVVRIQHSPVHELPHATRAMLSNLPQFLKPKAIRCSKCEEILQARHFGRKNIESVDAWLLVIFSGQPQVKSFKRMVPCMICSGGKTSVQLLNEHRQKKECRMKTTLHMKIIRKDLPLVSLDTTWNLGENATEAKQRLAKLATIELAQVERDASRGSGLAPHAGAPNSLISDATMSSASD